MALLQNAAFFEQSAEDSFEAVPGLQLAQPGRVGRGEVHGDVIGEGVDLAQTDQVVILSILERCIEVLADADAANPGIAAARNSRD